MKNSPRKTQNDRAFDVVCLAAQIELSQALEKFPPFNSAHEGYAVIKEELDELWAEVCKKKTDRSLDRLYAEAIQVAAMGLRFALDVCETRNAISSASSTPPAVNPGGAA